MKCSKCEKNAIVTKPTLCAKHFDEFVLSTVKDIIDKFSLFKKSDRICVAVSGGKDSLSLLDILTRLGYDVEGLFINEGIKNYREKSIEDLDIFVKKHNIKLRTVSFKEYANFSLDDAMDTGKFHACTICGTLRRYLLNKSSRDYDILATGHNMDDEAQTVMMNLARGNTSLFGRLGPITDKSEFFVRKVKPFYFLSEKHVLAYTIQRGIQTQFGECPYATTSYRAALREELNAFEKDNPGSKRNILDWYLRFKEESDFSLQPNRVSNVGVCKLCGEASQREICKACKLVGDVKLVFNSLKQS